jgi:hypothetical protein
MLVMIVVWRMNSTADYVRDKKCGIIPPEIPLSDHLKITSRFIWFPNLFGPKLEFGNQGAEVIPEHLPS